MTGANPQIILRSLATKGNEIISHAKEVFIFRSSVAYVAQEISSVVTAVLRIPYSQVKIQSLKQLDQYFVELDIMLHHLVEDKWIQPALNWPVTYSLESIDNFRKSMEQIIVSLGISTEQVIIHEEEQDLVNKRADLEGLRTNLLGLLAGSDKVELQKQVNEKVEEITQILTKLGVKARSRPPSAKNLVIPVKEKIEELLAKFKAINVEIEDLRYHEQIGCGGSGAVFRATRLSTAEVVAVKQLRSDRLTDASWNCLYAEIETMASVRHPFVLELVGAHIVEPYRIISRYCSGGSLCERLHRHEGREKLTATQLTKIAYQVALGMAHLHSLSIIHRDLKTLNILLDEENDACVADFGLSTIIKREEELSAVMGTPHYTAPEVLSHLAYGPKADVYSYGMILWEMLSGRIPYGEMSQSEVFEHVVKCSWRLPMPNGVFDGLKNLINRCWSRNPSDRPEFSEIVALFETGKINFPASEALNFNAIKSTQKTLPLNVDYALDVLRNPTNPVFRSVVDSVSVAMNEEIRNAIRREPMLSSLLKSDVNRDSILILASAALDDSDFPEFLENGALELCRRCLNSPNGQVVSAALKFCLRIPRENVPVLETLVPDAVSAIAKFRNVGSTIPYIIQFLSRFSNDSLRTRQTELAEGIIGVAMEANDQATVDAIGRLLPYCATLLTKTGVNIWLRVMFLEVSVPVALVKFVINMAKSEDWQLLLKGVLTADLRSDIDDIILEFLKERAHNNPEFFQKSAQMPELLPLIERLLKSTTPDAALFLLFCISQVKFVAPVLSTHSVLDALLTVEGHCVQKFQILTVLGSSEEFCQQTNKIDEILCFCVSEYTRKSPTEPVLKLMTALSTHSTGCALLVKKSVLGLFVQFFLSSAGEDVPITYVILRNIARHGYGVPQASLIMSCLMQSIIYDGDQKDEILETIGAMIRCNSDIAQGRDIRIVIIPLLRNQKSTRTVMLALDILCCCDVSLFRNVQNQLLDIIYNLLRGENGTHANIAVRCFKILSLLSEACDLSRFLHATQLMNFAQRLLSLLPSNDLRHQELTSSIRCLAESP